jgi:tyrosyl-tRNA synthetase
MVITDKEKIEEILTRGVEDIFIEEDLKSKLYSGQKLRIKFGIDPTSPNIHLGRSIPLRKLKAFQDLGHQIVLIIGDYTAKIGDPSDKLEKRPMLSDEDIKENLRNYLDQIGLILDLNKTEVRYNSEWLKNMNFFEISKLLECFTVQQMSKRRNFKERLESNKDIFLVEFLYPALQGYDSVLVNSDIEIGGFDQLFNLKAGRIVQRRYGQKEQDVMTFSMLEGLDGRKMSSSWGNVISLLDTAENMFGKIMSLKDDLIIKYFLLTTDTPISEIQQMEEKLKSGENPIIFKKALGKKIVSMYKNEEESQKALENWENVFSKKEIPDLLPEYSLVNNLVDTVLKNKLVNSKSDYRRILSQNGIHNLTKGEIVSNIDYIPDSNTVIKIGKQKFFKVI